MSKTGSGIVFLLLLIIGGCAPLEAPQRAPLEGGGKVLLYLQPLGKEATRLSFSIEAVSAVREDGAEFPLSLSLKEVKGREHAAVQKRLAVGAVPPGDYTGVSIKVAGASVAIEEGEARLLIPEEAVRASGRFRVERKGAVALFLTLFPSRSVREGFSFEPAFALSTYSGALRNLLGFVSDADYNILLVFNKKTMAVENVVATGSGPKGLALDRELERVYAALAGEDAVEIIDVTMGDIIGRVTLNIGDEPLEIALGPDGTTLVTANFGTNTASVIDTGSQSEIARVQVGDQPVSAVIDPSGRRAYVLNSQSHSISVVDLSTNTVALTAALRETPRRGVFNRSGDRLYIITADSPDLLIVDPETLVVAERVFIGAGALSVAVDDRTDLVYAGLRDGEVVVVDPFARMFVDTIAVAGAAEDIAVDQEENTLLVLVPEEGVLQKVNIVSREVTAEAGVEEGSHRVVVMDGR